MSNADLSTILNRILDAAADNLRIAKILMQMGLDPDNITYDALFNRLFEIVLHNITVANIEMRTRVLEANVMGTHGILELAPFFETGRVWHSMSEVPWQAMHSVGGMGFRAIAEPFVVGYVDVGWGGEGPAVFSGINYPF